VIFLEQDTGEHLPERAGSAGDQNRSIRPLEWTLRGHDLYSADRTIFRRVGGNSELMPPDELLHNSSRCGCRLPAFPTSGWITQALAPIGDALPCLAFPCGVFFVHRRAKHAVMTFEPLNVFG
jgi:hypothetical protein